MNWCIMWYWSIKGHNNHICVLCIRECGLYICSIVYNIFKIHHCYISIEIAAFRSIFRRMFIVIILSLTGWVISVSLVIMSFLLQSLLQLLFLLLFAYHFGRWYNLDRLDYLNQGNVFHFVQRFQYCTWQVTYY